MKSLGPAAQSIRITNFKSCLHFSLTDGVISGYERTEAAGQPVVQREIYYREECITTIPKQSPIKLESDEKIDDKLAREIRALEKHFSL
jgi:hypothetical protein